MTTTKEDPLFTITRYIIVAVEYGDNVDGEGRVTGVFNSPAYAEESMAEQARGYCMDNSLNALNIGTVSAVAGDDELGCRYRIERIEMPVFQSDTRKGQP